MSNANKPQKVLRVALRRLEHWGKKHWARRDEQTGVTVVCLEGAIFGFKNGSQNPACTMARDIVLEIVKEKYKDEWGRSRFLSIPAFNDHSDTTQEMVMEVAKLALIRAESGGLLRKTEDECYVPAKKALKAGKFL